MTGTFVIAANELRRRLRDRSVIVIAIIAPLTIAAVMSFAFKGASTFSYTLGVVNEDHGALSSSLVRGLDTPALRSVVHPIELASAATARADVRSKKVDAALVIPAGFTSLVESGRPASVTTLSSLDNTIAGSFTEALAHGFVAQINADRLSLFTALAAGAPQTELRRLIGEVTSLRSPLASANRAVGAHVVKPVSYYSPGMAIFFLLFAISFAARSYFVDKDTGMIERIRAAPIRPIEVLLGKALSVFVYGLASLLLIAVVTSVLFGASWGNPVAVAIVCLAMVIAVVALTTFVIAVSRNQRQAEGIAALVVFGLALLGGNFIFISQAPPMLRRLALLTPNGWAMRTFTDLSTQGGGPATVTVPVMAMLSFALVVAVLAVAASRRAAR